MSRGHDVNHSVCVCVCVVGYEDDLARSRKNKSSLCDMDWSEESLGCGEIIVFLGFVGVEICTLM